MIFILFEDLNKVDSTILTGQQAIKEFLSGFNLKHQICPDGTLSEDGDIGITWSIPCRHRLNTNQHKILVHNYHRKKNKPLLILEKGFLKRDSYYSIGWNNIVGFGYYHNQNMPSDRLEKLNLNLKPYIPRQNGNILLCGQVPWDAQLQHLSDYRAWLISLVQRIRKYTNRPIVYRPHPKQFVKKAKAIHSLPGTILSKQSSLEDDFKEAFVVISFNSNCLVDALIEGIPFFSFDPGSMVHDLANHDLTEINNPKFPSDSDRLQTLSNIAYSQWNIDEIKSGIFWNHIKQGMTISLSPEIDYHYRHNLKKLLS